MNLFSKLFVSGIKYDKENIENTDIFPFSIEAIKNFEELKFNKNITFFIEENGVGKSTFIEALAVCLKLNPEGGTENFNFSTNNIHSNLSNYIRVYSTGNISKL